ncbi:MAG TPA: EamA family transporter [Candidatus Saccharimonadia bacterium]|nr:EamA family transporter [Candidatus Saccharimonadia bacterium]
MLDWKILAVTTPLLFVSYQALSKLLPKDISAFLINAYASLVGLVVMLLLFFLTSPNKSLQLPPKYLSIAVGIGLFISFGNFGIIKAYSLGAPQSAFTPLFYIALIIYGTLFGWLIWHEKLTLLQIAGILLACIGIYMAAHFKK